MITTKKNKNLMGDLQSLFNQRELLLILTTREIKVRYRQSILGFGWALVQPVVQMVVISVIFGRFLQIPHGDIPYPIFSYAAILPWTLFSGSLSAAIPSVHLNMNLVTKVYFPREIFPLASILSRLVDFFIASIVFIALLVWYRIPVQNTWIFVLPLLLIQTFLSIGLGLLGSAVSVFIRDVSYAIPIIMTLWMYATPVIYPIEVIPLKWRPLYLLNPMAGIIDSYRRVLLQGEMPHFVSLGLSTLISVAIFVFAYIYFKNLEMSMADII